jgi:hypothetical protein
MISARKVEPRRSAPPSCAHARLQPHQPSAVETTPKCAPPRSAARRSASRMSDPAKVDWRRSAARRLAQRSSTQRKCALLTVAIRTFTHRKSIRLNQTLLRSDVERSAPERFFPLGKPRKGLCRRAATPPGPNSRASWPKSPRQGFGSSGSHSTAKMLVRSDHESRPAPPAHYRRPGEWRPALRG